MISHAAEEEKGIHNISHLSINMNKLVYVLGR